MDEYLDMLSSSVPVLNHRPIPEIDPVLQDLSFTIESTPIAPRGSRSTSPRSSSGDASYVNEFGQDGQDFDQVQTQTQPFVTPVRPKTSGKQPRKQFTSEAVNSNDSSAPPDDLDIELESDEESEAQARIIEQHVAFAEDYGRSNNLSEDLISSAKAFANLSKAKQNVLLFYNIAETRAKQLKVVDSWHPDTATLKTMRSMVKAVTFSVKAPAYKGYYVLRVIKALLMQRNIGLPANWMSMPPVLATVEGILNSMLTNFRSSLKKTLLDSIKPGSKTDIAQLAQNLIKSKMGQDFQISSELWGRFAIWRATIQIYSGNLFWDKVDTTLAKMRQKALQQFPGPDQSMERQQLIHAQIKNSLIIDYNKFGNPMELRGVTEPPLYDRLQGNSGSMQKFTERLLVEQTGKVLPSVEDVDARTLNPRGVSN